MDLEVIEGATFDVAFEEYIGGTGAGTSNYNSLSNRPITNLTGTDSAPVLIRGLANGVYRITNTWQMIEGGALCAADKDDLFYVQNTLNTSLVTRVGAYAVSSYSWRLNSPGVVDVQPYKTLGDTLDAIPLITNWDIENLLNS